MVNFKIEADGYLIENKFLYSFSQPNWKYINLGTVIWDDMTYDKIDYNIINFPWEYDIKWNRVICLVWKDNKLNYLVFMKQKKFWVIQSPDILESDEIQNMEYWLYTNDSVEKKIDQLELEWEKIKLEEVSISNDTPTPETAWE